MVSYSAISVSSRFARFFWVFLAVLVAPAFLGGCAGPMREPNRPIHSSGSPFDRSTSRSVRLGTNGMDTQRAIEHDSSPVISLASWESLPAESLSMTAEEVRCQAANFAVLARLTELERGLAAEMHRRDRCLTPNQKALQQELLWLRTLTRANEAAASALEGFYRLAEAQQQATNLAARKAEIESMQSDLRELKAHDLPVEQEPAILDRNLLSIQEAQAELEGGLTQGWAQLRVLLGPNASYAIPQMLVALHLPPNPPEPMEALDVTRQRHPELRSLQMTIQRLTPETLPLARAVLQQYEAALGTVQPGGWEVSAQQLLKVFCVFGPNNCPLPSQLRELEVRRVQLTELLAQREQAVAAEVEAALISWRTAISRWQSANQRLESWQTQLDNLAQKQAVDEDITAFDLAEARLGILEAQSDCIKFAFELRQAQVTLWTAQGILSVGCGLPGDAPLPCAPSRWLLADRPEGPQSPPEMEMPPLPATRASHPHVNSVIAIKSCRPLSRRN